MSSVVDCLNQLWVQRGDVAQYEASGPNSFLFDDIQQLGGAVDDAVLVFGPLSRIVEDAMVPVFHVNGKCVGYHTARYGHCQDLYTHPILYHTLREIHTRVTRALLGRPRRVTLAAVAPSLSSIGGGRNTSLKAS